MKSSQGKLSRRKFLFAAGAGTAAAGAALVAKQSTDSVPASEKSAQSGKGYQLTEHVQNYYRTAKI